MADIFHDKTAASVSVPEIWSSKLYAWLRASLQAANLVNRDYEGEIREKGDTVHILGFPATVLPVADVSSGTPVDAVSQDIEETLLVINKHKAIHVAVTNLARIQSSINLMSGWSEKMSYALSKQIDTDLITELKLASASAPDHIILGSGTAGAFNPLDDVLSAKDLLDLQDVPDENRWMLMNPVDYNKILALTNVQSSDFISGGQPLMDGKIPPIFGFMPAKSTQMVLGEVLFGHPSVVTLAIQRGIDFSTHNMLPQGIHADRLVASTLYGMKIVDNKRVVLLNSSGS